MLSLKPLKSIHNGSNAIGSNQNLYLGDVLSISSIKNISNFRVHHSSLPYTSSIYVRLRSTSPHAMPNPFNSLLRNLKLSNGSVCSYYDLNQLKDDRLYRLPYSIRLLLESAVRNCDNFKVLEKDVEDLLNWHKTCDLNTEIRFKPARVILQDFTGVPVIVDLAAMRDATKSLGGNPLDINPYVPVDLVIDHSIQVDVFNAKDALQKNESLEITRNMERFQFLKWGRRAFQNLTIIPPGAGIVHQINLEYLARVVFNQNQLLYPDSLIGTDSHTPMVNGLGVLGWGVGGIEAEAVMLGQPISMLLPQVIGFHLSGQLAPHVTSTDLVLAITTLLRKKGVVNKFIEFYGPGLAHLTISDRATIANMSPEMGATVCYFPVDKSSISYMKLTGRSPDHIEWTEKYLQSNSLFHTNSTDTLNKIQPEFSQSVHLDLSQVVPSIAGPKRPHDNVLLSNAKRDFQSCLANENADFKGFGIKAIAQEKTVNFQYHDQHYLLRHGSVVIAAITSCTNTSNPSVMVGAGLLAKKAVDAGLSIAPYIKTSLAPGSTVVTEYLKQSNLLPYLQQLGFDIVGYGCTTCIGNSGPLPSEIAQVIEQNDLIVAGVLSGNRNFEGRIHPHVKANYLASPPLVVAYAIAGNMNIDLTKEPIGISQKTGKAVYLKEIWPMQEEINQYIAKHVLAKQFQKVYSTISEGSSEWQSLDASDDKLYPWDPKSTYIHQPPYFEGMSRQLNFQHKVQDARVLLLLGDFITTDHISPAGNIAKDSPAGEFLIENGIPVSDFNSYGSRRGNDEVMVRGTFANIRLTNQLIGQPGPLSIYQPTGQVSSVYDVAKKYQSTQTPLILIAGRLYGSGSSRDWAAKGTKLLGVKCVIAQSYERIHRSNLVQFGIVPLQFREGESAESLGLTGKESYSFELGQDYLQLEPGQNITVKVTGGHLSEFNAILRFDTMSEIVYYAHGGVLHYVIRESLQAHNSSS